ncbi:carbohydrate ABC transporter permease [Paenibacillus sp. HB172176]|uniref:carbohydrate ABC transporter permease n=1 Tax=Paenibacillus sp. HB172176 TaxID=2493690 RepID=UPI0014397A3A|nr:carbohydrate ABC transporter permease [Paenibacillus sp. HB172176]
MKTNGLQLALKYAVLAVISVIILMPYYWMVVTSLKSYTKIFDFPPQWFPSPIKWSNYVDLFKQQPFHLYLFNSVYIAVVVTLGVCLFGALAGYAFAKLDFRYKNFIFLFLLSSMMIPTEVTTIPLYIAFGKIGMVDTHLPLILPPMLGAAGIFGVFLMRQFFITIPNDLVEAAKIDGCSPIGTFLRIMFPLAAPAIATLSIITFLQTWNEFFEPLVYLNSSKLFTIPLALSLFSDDGGTKGHLIMAASVVATLPLLTVFFFAQRKFIEGVAMTGIK